MLRETIADRRSTPKRVHFDRDACAIASQRNFIRDAPTRKRQLAVRAVRRRRLQAFPDRTLRRICARTRRRWGIRCSAARRTRRRNCRSPSSKCSRLSAPIVSPGCTMSSIPPCSSAPRILTSNHIGSFGPSSSVFDASEVPDRIGDRALYCRRPQMLVGGDRGITGRLSNVAVAVDDIVGSEERDAEIADRAVSDAATCSRWRP